MKDPRVYLAHILERIERIAQYTAAGKETFFSDPMMQDAVIRNLEIIGEAARRISREYQEKHPEIPWRGMKALRNVLIHEYEGVDMDQVWEVIEGELPPLKASLEKFLPPLNELEAELAGDSEKSDNTDY
ncbi:MAG: DUF86 domain-containing protein [bacterium]